MTERLRVQARAALDQYRQNIFPAYEAAINVYLQRFNAGFRLGAVTSVNNRGGSSATYNVLINNVAVALTTDSGPSFRTRSAPVIGTRSRSPFSLRLSIRNRNWRRKSS